MEIRVLRYFLVTAREQNITKAAELLHITQPTFVETAGGAGRRTIRHIENSDL